MLCNQNLGANSITKFDTECYDEPVNLKTCLLDFVNWIGVQTFNLEYIVNVY